MIGRTKDLLDLIDSECAARSVVRTVLEVSDVYHFVRASLLCRQSEESSAINSMSGWVEIVAKELEELGKVLGQRAAVVDPELLEERGCH